MQGISLFRILLFGFEKFLEKSFPAQDMISPIQGIKVSPLK